MHDWRDWSNWLQEGYFVSYLRDGIRYYEHIIARDYAHWEYEWPEDIAATTDSGPFVPDDLEITSGYNKEMNVNQFWQLIFGIKGQAYIYIELPTDLHRHGIPKEPKPSTTMRKVSHYEEWMSSYIEPTFITEHFLMRPECQQIAISAYNPNAIAMTDLWLNIMIAKCLSERIGTEDRGVLTPTSSRWQEVLDKLYRRVIPHRPISLMGVRGPAATPSGE